MALLVSFAISFPRLGSSTRSSFPLRSFAGNCQEFGEVQTKAAIQKRLADTDAKRSKIKELVAQGKSLDEIKAAVGDPPPGQGRAGGRGGPNFPTFTEVVYKELTTKGA